MRQFIAKSSLTSGKDKIPNEDKSSKDIYYLYYHFRSYVQTLMDFKS